MTGAPRGNKNASNAKVAKNALNRAMAIRSGEDVGPMVDSFKALVDIWAVQIDKALDGDNQSATMIVDRLDGRPMQATEISGSIELEAYELNETERSARIASLLNTAGSRRDEQADNGERTDMDTTGGSTD